MTLHDELRDRLADHATSLGLLVATEVIGGNCGRADLIILKPFTVIEIKTNPARYKKFPEGWKSQCDRYSHLFGYGADRWLLFDVWPPWADAWAVKYSIGWRLGTVSDFESRLTRFVDEGLALRDHWTVRS